MSTLVKRIENDMGCVECPKCHDAIPLGNGGPERLGHLVFTRNGELRIMCPKYVAKVMRWKSR